MSRTLPVEPVEGPPSERASGLPVRYEDVRLLGRGGFGEVHLVHDRKLGRAVAMKILRPDINPDLAEEIRARFLSEITLTAALDHPGIIPVHDYGELADGRLWFTMAEVRGRTLRAVIDESLSSPLARHRLLEIFARVCDAVAYAHSRGVIHRDLKPDNIMVGDFGRVMVMDWGIARRGDVGLEPSAPTGPSPVSPDHLTRAGEVLGTPAYMAPEQARGELGRVGPRSDVYALGAILHHLLSGKRPYPIEPLPADTPAELWAICTRAMAFDPEQRHADAGALALEVESFLGGARRRERALAELGKAAARGPEIAGRRDQAEALRAEARRLLGPIRPFDPVESKLPGWNREDEAARLDHEAALLETSWMQEVHGALTIEPDLPEAHQALADHYRDRLLEAERGKRPLDAARFEVLLRAHDRGKHTEVLSGRGALTLVTDPAGARVELHRYVTRQRRLVAEPTGDLGITPLREVPLAQGSYLLKILAPGRAEVAYPVLIERGEHWDGRRPGSEEPYAIPLPRIEEMSAGEVYVPAGWAWTGGDPDAPDSLPRRRVWIDGFMIGRFPVTNEEYLVFLNDLVEQGREDEALAACPRAPLGMSGLQAQRVSYARDAGGRFHLPEEMKTQPLARWPVVLLDWCAASAYAAWKAARTGKGYRLPSELEREKAARGVDGRFCPWGDYLDATWSCVLDGHVGEPVRAPVDAYPLDESPYGARGLAGNVRDHCLEVWRQDGPPVREGRLVLEPASMDEPDFRAVRGGAWSSPMSLARSAARFGNRPADRRENIGIRSAR